MGYEGGKVHKLEAVRYSDQPEDGGVDRESDSSLERLETQRDMSKVAMIVSLLAVILLVIFFFGMNRNIAGLTDEVKGLGVLREDVSSLDQRIVQLQHELPSQMKKMIAHDLVNEMAMKASYLGNTLEDESMRSRMHEILKTLKEVRDGLEQ